MKQVVIKIVLISITMFLSLSSRAECKVGSLPKDMRGFLSECGQDLANWGVKVSLDPNNQTLIGDAGSFSARYFRTVFESELQSELKDEELGGIISSSFFTTVARHFDYEDEERLKEWVIDNLMLIGAENVTNDAIIDRIKSTSLRHAIKANQQEKDAVNDFLDQVRSNFALLRGDKNVSPNAPVVIITGPYGGGHHSVAEEIKATLQMAGMAAEVLDECQDFDDPLATLTNGKFRGCRIYNDIQVRENNLQKATILYHFNWLLHAYITPNQRGKLRKKINDIKASLIISTVHHITEIPRLSYAMEKPMFIAITDFQFPTGQWKYLDMFDKIYVKYLLPRSDKLFFRESINTHGYRRKGTNTRFIFETFFNKKNETEDYLTKNILDRLDLFLVTGFPLNPIVTPPQNSGEVLEARERLKLNLDISRKVINITLGGTPIPEEMKSILDTLIKNKDGLVSNIQIALLTAGNKDLAQMVTKVFQDASVPILKDELYENEKDRNFSDKIIVKILDRLDRQKMADVYKASDLVLSKAGGATTAELIASSTYYVRATGLKQWEVENAIFLQRLGLAAISDESKKEALDINYAKYLIDPPEEELITQVNELLGRMRMFKGVSGQAAVYDRSRLINLINRTIDEFYRPRIQ